MRCKHKYNKINIDCCRKGSDISMGQMARQGNKAISGLATDGCVAVKKRGCRR